MGLTGDGVEQLYYTPHLKGVQGRQRRNVEQTRMAMLERMHMRVLSEMAVNRFKWEGLPPTVDPRFLELTLFKFALSVFYKEDEVIYGDNAYFALQGGASGRSNMMDNPTAFTVYGDNFRGKIIKRQDCVPIWANYMRVPDLDIIYIYATKLADIDRSIEINAHNSRKPKVLIANEAQRLSVDNMNRQVDAGQSVISVNGQPGGYDPEMFQTFDLGVEPKTIEELHIVRTRIMGECMTALGIDNANQDKKERMVSSEVDANNGQVMSMRAVNLNERKRAADAINERYGLDVKVSYHVDADMAVAKQETAAMGGANGESGIYA